MFKKRVKISNSHQISNKDRKLLKEQMTKLEFEPEYVAHFLNDKNHEEEFGSEEDAALCMDKI